MAGPDGAGASPVGPTAAAGRFLRSGKVRDLYRLADGRILLVASDRISAFDVVLPSLIPDKGRVLTGVSRFWFAQTGHIITNHLLSADPADLGDEADATAREHLRGRIMLCRPTTVLPVEAVVRGYLAGSGLKEYRAAGTICGVPLPPGLREGDPFPSPILTPATKAEAGAHDENIDFDRMIAHLAAELALPMADAGDMAVRVRDAAIALYRFGAAHAEASGILLADTKFEFGLTETGALILIDEVMTPDSSRFWDKALWAPGGPQPSFDKQFVRDWLETQPWGKTAPGPTLPPDVIAGTRARYVEAFERITGASFDRYLGEDVIAR
jgi:phosphoribosylaminoimidazole-succinocarboxamide synthase